MIYLVGGSLGDISPKLKEDIPLTDLHLRVVIFWKFVRRVMKGSRKGVLVKDLQGFDERAIDAFLRVIDICSILNDNKQVEMMTAGVCIDAGQLSHDSISRILRTYLRRGERGFSAAWATIFNRTSGCRTTLDFV